jgi:hypothetical protein
MLNAMTDEHKQLATNKFSPEVIVNGMHNLGFDKVNALDEPFLIPIYQRLYSWEPEHVKRLLDDLYNAFDHSKTSEYFIGSLVTTREKKQNNDVLELIDGQQRLTTLWLVASVLVNKAALADKSRTQWHNFLTSVDQPQQPRLDFSGREADIQALKGFVGEVGIHSGDNQKWLKNDAMASARSTINDFLNEVELKAPSQLQAFSDYVWSKATFVITQLHPLTDKERFFDTMNSRGVQLEKHEILKALMLTNLTEIQRAAYGKAWDLCADIEGYIPGSLQTILQYGLKPLDEAAIMLLSPSSVAVQSVTVAGTDDMAAETSLEDILSPDFIMAKAGDDILVKPQSHKSPVSFPVFLLHVLKIYVEASSSEFIKSKAGKPITLDDKQLVEVFEGIFKGSEHQHRLRFIECLLECRLLLDNFVIKGELNDSSEHSNWQIASRLVDAKKQSRMKRTGETWASIRMLQSMMHFSPMNGTQRITWLTPTLKALREQRNNFSEGTKGAEKFLQALQEYDQTYVQSILGVKDINEVLGAGKSKGLGTKVHHYWFYKLEYCLWELWYNQPQWGKRIACEKPVTLSGAVFRMRSISSVEHVSPQSQNNGEVKKAQLDRFGNLALISVSENSTYSDKDPIEKKGIFKVRQKKGLIQSLKLAHIFAAFGDRVQDWDDDAMLKHEQTMVMVLKAFHPEWMTTNNNVKA